MKKSSLIHQIITIMVISFGLIQTAKAQPLTENLAGTYNLAAPRTAKVQYFHMETVLINRAPDGVETGREKYILDLKCEPSGLTGKKGDTYTCLQFAVQKDSDKIVTVPALKDWSYVFNPGQGNNDKGEVLGIEHAKFENLTDSNGEKLAGNQSYFVYNTFIDFHSFCDVFGGPSPAGKSIGDLHKINDKIVHYAAHSQPPVDLGSNVGKGSTFTNGEITLAFKGLSRENDTPLALVGFDSGDSHFVMNMEPAPGFTVKTRGSSHYWGDLYVNLKTHWISHVEMEEVVVAQTKLPAPNNPVSSVTVRHSVIRNIAKPEILTAK